MKKKLVVGALVGVVVLGGALVVGANDDKDVSLKNKAEIISLEEAETIAKGEVENGVVEEIELEREKHKLMYKVEFDDKDIDVYLDAHSGEVIGVQNDDDDDDKTIVKDTQTKISTAKQNENEISKDEAIKLAEKTVNGKVHSIEKEQDDGRIEYELELSTERGEVDVEIDATTGKILEIDYED